MFSNVFNNNFKNGFDLVQARQHVDLLDDHPFLDSFQTLRPLKGIC
jgi:hypothetical protein